MNEVLSKMLNQEVEIRCTSSGESLRGRIKTCGAGILTLESDGRMTYIAVDKIISMSQR
ncbi:MAG: MM0924 family protein [Acidobacteriota bacterium]|nr:hypothetical protein [Acidobacteriota bacterium]